MNPGSRAKEGNNLEHLSVSRLEAQEQYPESRQIAGQVLTRKTVEFERSTLRPSVHLSLARTEEEEKKNEDAMEEEKIF